MQKGKYSNMQTDEKAALNHRTALCSSTFSILKIAKNEEHSRKLHLYSFIPR